MYNILANRKRSYGIKTFLVNTMADIDAIPLSLSTIAVGSIAIIAETGEKYILNQFRQWELLSSSGESSGGDSGEIVIYEGGDLMTDSNEGNEDINYDGGAL